MTDHPKEAVELLARALYERASAHVMCGQWNAVLDAVILAAYRASATALLDRLAPYYRNQQWEADAIWCEDEADNCADAAKWGGAPKSVADCKAAAHALGNAAFRIRAGKEIK